MVALKAKYNYGKIDWEEPPPFEGCCDLIVIFAPVETEMSSMTHIAKRRCIDQIQAYFEDVPSDVSLVDELIAERRREAACE